MEIKGTNISESSIASVITVFRLATKEDKDMAVSIKHIRKGSGVHSNTVKKIVNYLVETGRVEKIPTNYNDLYRWVVGGDV